ncbi:MAG: IPT/TIG domain-containing protein [Planctomycetes bacterium]|nr:IPT/TIG domain-containing protein [Planctomycetota bacterium]
MAPNANPNAPQPTALDAERERRLAALRAIKRPPNQTLGNAKPRARKPAESGRKELDSISPKLLQDRRGLYARYYAFAKNPVEVLLDPAEPELDKRTPDVTRIDQRVYFPGKDAWADIPFDKGNFMAVWEGFLVIPADGDYWLYLGADLFGNVRLHGEYVLINDMQDYTEVSTVLTLTRGLHPIRIEYLEARNGSVVQDLGACNFMYVPQGESKPVAVPPEMLLLPEALWSDAAPIITRLSKPGGEIGDEITIYGENLDGAVTEAKNVPLADIPKLKPLVTVQIAGQNAPIADITENSIRVRVPVGATTGKVVVFKARAAPGPGESGVFDAIYTDAVPSNSLDFTVTTQFGLYASWHNLVGWSKYDFIEDGVHEPDLVRLERDFPFESRDRLNLPFKNNPLACRWEGKLGLPADWAADRQPRLVRFAAYGRLRVTLGTETRATAALPGGSNDLTTLDFEVPAGEERYLPLRMDWTCESGPAGLRVAEMKQLVPVNEGQPVGWQEVRALPFQLFFPPVVPPQPPKIKSVKPLWPEGEQPPVLPYTVTTTRPSVREGQEFEFVLEVYGNAEVRAQPVHVSIDGRPVVYDVVASSMINATTESRTCRAVLPSMCGEGAITARLAVVTSDPFLIDVTNKGLVAYYYDLPNPGGYTQMPDPDPLVCFLVRKDAQVNFENANDFNLPFPAETFAVEWFGAIIVEREGEYVFTCRSDDGIKVWIDGNLVLIDDNLHYQREKSSEKIRLAPGLHTFRMQFFENNVHEVAVLYWQAADEQGEFLPKQVIPKRNWTWDQHPTLPSKTSTGKRSDGSDPQ